jgi:hypothetical protein
MVSPLGYLILKNNHREKLTSSQAKPKKYKEGISMWRFIVPSLLFCQFLTATASAASAPFIAVSSPTGPDQPLAQQSINDVTITITPNHNPSAFTQPVTFTVEWVDGWGNKPPASVTLADRFNSQEITIAYEPLVFNGSVDFTTSSLAVGTHEVVAYVSNGGTVYNTSIVHTVNKAAANVALSSNPASVAARLNATLTATLSVSTATGTVTFRDGSVLLGTANVVDGVATLTTSFSTAGAHTLYADYSGDNNYTPCTGTANVQVVDPTVTTTISPQAGMATFVMNPDISVTGYFTLHKGANVPCGTATQVFAGQDASGAAASRYGSLALVAATDNSYTVRNLTQSSEYTACFTTASLTAPLSRGFSTNGETGVGNSWIAVPGNTGISSYNKLAFAPDGTPYLAYVDGNTVIDGVVTRDVNNAATVQKYDGTSWVMVGNEGFGSMGVGGDGINLIPVFAGMDGISLAFSPDGTPYVAVSYLQTQRVTCGRNCPPGLPPVPSRVTSVLRYAGTSWVGMGYWTDGASPSLAFAPEGTPWVAYSSEDDGGKAKVRRLDGSGWVMATPGQFPNSNAHGVSLAFAPNGTPYVVFSDGNNAGKATYMTLTNGSWTLTAASTTAADNLSLAFDGDGVPYLAYRALDGTNKAMVAKLSADQSGWLADTSSGPSDYPALALSPGGAPFLAYMGTTTGKLLVRTFVGGSWHITGDNGVSTGQAAYASLAFAPDGQLYTTYSDGDLGNRATVMRARLATTITISSSSNPMYAGDLSGKINSSISCNVAAAGQMDFSGTITFKEGTDVLGSDDFSTLSFSTASLAITNLGAGSHTITAEYAGNDLCSPITSQSLVQVIQKRPTTTTISSDANPALAGDINSTISATTSCDIASTGLVVFGGTINFQEGGAVLGTGTFDSFTGNKAEFQTSSLSLGGHDITAVFAGDGWCDASSASLHQTIIQPPLAKNITTGVSYATLADALSDANPTTPDEILLLGTPYSDAVDLTKGILLKGGWNPRYDGLNGQPTTLSNGLTSESGNTVLELIDINGMLSIKGGSLRTNGVMVR